MSYLAVMGVDPGTGTGAAWCVCGANGTIATRMAQPPSPPQSKAIRGSYVAQAEELTRIYLGLRSTARGYQRKGKDIRLIIGIEDFILTRFKSSEREGLDPVRMTTAFITMLHVRNLIGDTEIVYQQPADAMMYNNDRLRHWGLWKVGAEEHERDAMRHMLLAIVKSNSRNNGSKPKRGRANP